MSGTGTTSGDAGDGSAPRGGGRRGRLRARWTSAGPARIALLALVAIVVAGAGTAPAVRLTDELSLADEAAAEAAPVPPPAPSPPPPGPAPAPVPPPPPAQLDATDLLAVEYGVTDLGVAGIRVEDDGLGLITGIFAPGYDWIADEGDWREWTRHFEQRPLTVPGFAEHAVVLLDPRPPCVDFHRQIIGLSSGVEGDAGARIERALLEATGPRPFPYAGSDSVPGSSFWCLDPAKGEAPGTGYVLDEVLAVPCAMPGRDIRCYVVTRWFYAQGVRSHWLAESHVFDASTGDRLEGPALHPSIEVERLERLTLLVLHAIERVPVAASGDIDAGMPSPSSPVVLPSAEGVRVLWLDYARWLSPLGLDDRWVVIPWDVIAAG